MSAVVNISCLWEWSWVFSECLGRAYGHFLQGDDVRVETLYSSKPFFYFLSDIKEEKLREDRGVPYAQKAYQNDFDPKKEWGEIWTPPPIKDYYSKTFDISSQKPILIINNKYNIEWGVKPYNILDLDALFSIFTKFQSEFTIYYIRYDGSFHNKNSGYYDNVPSVPFDDYKMIREKFPKVNTIYDFMGEYDCDYNTAQCMLMSKSDRHISVAGGNAVLSSYFSKDNIIFTGKNCPRNASNRAVWRDNSWLSVLSGSNIYGVMDNEQLIKRCEGLWLR